MRQFARRPVRSSILALLALLLAGQPGCLIGSPLAAFSGRLYGMTRDDVGAMTGSERGAIWGKYPVAAAIDLPFAFVLDTGFLPIALIFAGIDLLIGDTDHGHGTKPGQHTHDDEDKDKKDEDEDKPHTHADGTTHSHDPDDEEAEATRDAARERDAKATRERLERERLERADAERRKKEEARERDMRERAAGSAADQERREADLRRERAELDAERARLAREREALERERQARPDTSDGVAPITSPTPPGQTPGR